MESYIEYTPVAVDKTAKALLSICFYLLVNERLIRYVLICFNLILFKDYKKSTRQVNKSPLLKVATFWSPTSVAAFWRLNPSRRLVGDSRRFGCRRRLLVANKLARAILKSHFNLCLVEI